TILAGAEMLNYAASVRLGRGPHVVVEADEYDRRFLRLAPRVAIVTSVEPDHLDYFRDLAEIEATFAAFVGRLPADGRLVVCADDAGARCLAAPHHVTYGLGADAGWRARDCRATTLAAPELDGESPAYGMQFVVVTP